MRRLLAVSGLLLIVLGGLNPAVAQDQTEWAVITPENVAQLTQFRQFDETLIGRDLSFSPDGRWLAWTYNELDPVKDFVRLWNIADDELSSIDSGGQFVYHPVFNATGTLLAADNGRRIYLWDVETGQLIDEAYPYMAYDGYIQGLAFSPDGSALAAVGFHSMHFSTRGNVWTWTVNDSFGVAPEMIYLTNWLISLAYSPDGTVLATGSEWTDRVIQIWNALSGEAMWLLEGHAGAVKSLAFSPDGSLLVAGDREGTIRFWDWRHAVSTAIIDGHERTIQSIVFNPAGTLVASASDDGTIRFWDRMTARNLAVLTVPGAVYGIAFSPDGRWLASVSIDDTIRLWGIPGIN